MDRIVIRNSAEEILWQPIDEHICRYFRDLEFSTLQGDTQARFENQADDTAQNRTDERCEQEPADDLAGPFLHLAGIADVGKGRSDGEKHEDRHDHAQQAREDGTQRLQHRNLITHYKAKNKTDNDSMSRYKPNRSFINRKIPITHPSSR